MQRFHGLFQLLCVVQTLGLGKGRQEGTFRRLVTAQTVVVAWAPAPSGRGGEKQGGSWTYSECGRDSPDRLWAQDMREREHSRRP